MRHLRAGRKLKRTSSHKKALMRNLATSLFEHKKIQTTEAKAKELRPYAERLITKAKHALQNEQQGLLQDGHKVDVHNRRVVGKQIKNKAVLQELFDAIAPAVADRQGGYTRIIKTGIRRGDSGRTAIIELVDWSNEQDGVTPKKKKQTTKKVDKVQPKENKKEEVVEEAPVAEEVVEETPAAEETTEEVKAEDKNADEAAEEKAE